MASEEKTVPTETSTAGANGHVDENAAAESTARKHFIHDLVEQDNATGRFGGKVITRFPPEPNGYLHIGHAQAIWLNFGVAGAFGGSTNLRFDDTNPAKEEQEYIDAIAEDVQWLGFQWKGDILYASDYFDQLYDWAVQLIKNGKAYVDQLTPDEIREHRGTLTAPGKNSPYRDRPVEESLTLLERMKNGEFKEGEAVLRAKIDMGSGNINMRDPVMYRIKDAPHPRTGTKWKIYPMYDWAHGQSDSIEGVTHSICTLEYEDHRPLYDWYLDQLGIYHPQQIEFARLAVEYMVTSKRRLLRLVNEGHVRGWDDPRMPTIRGLRRAGYTAEALKAFAEMAGITKSNGVVEYQMLEYCVRQDLNKRALRVMGVLNPIKIVITNYPENHVDELEAINNPENPDAGTRILPFSRELYIERDDFMEDPPSKFYRLAPGREVRLRYAYFIKCEEVVKDADGNITELRCTYDPETRGGNAPDGRKVKATIHWLSAAHAVQAEVRLYDKLFTIPDLGDMEEGKDFTDYINPNSLTVVKDAFVEPGLADATPGDRYQFERLAYFSVDPDSTPGKPVFNRTVSLKDEWAKLQKSGGK